MSDLTLLTTDEAVELQKCEETIQRGLKVFYEVGNALALIRDKRLYRSSHGTFEEYCNEKWKLSKTHANRLVQSSQVIENLTPIGVIPENESVIRPLTSLPPEQQIEVWKAAVASAPEGKPTAKDVEAAAWEYKHPDPGTARVRYTQKHLRPHQIGYDHPRRAIQMWVFVNRKPVSIIIPVDQMTDWLWEQVLKDRGQKPAESVTLKITPADEEVA